MVTFKNGTFKATIPENEVPAGFLFTESTQAVNLENIDIDWNLSAAAAAPS